MNELMKPIEHKDLRVLTTAQLAEAYGTDAQVLIKNIHRNRDRYVEGKHYFKLDGDGVKSFISSCQFDMSIKTSQLYLWTEIGALLHAKSLNTDQAWEVYEKLLEVYFRVRNEKSGPLMLPEKALSLIDNTKYSAEMIELARALASDDPESEMEQMNDRLAEYRRAAASSDQVTAGFPFFREDMLTIYEIAKRIKGRYPLNIGLVIGELFRAGYIDFRRMTPDENPQRWRYIYAATDKAFEAGAEQIENTRSRYKKKDYYYYWRFPELVVKEVFLPKWKYMLVQDDPWREGYAGQYRTWDLSEW